MQIPFPQTFTPSITICGEIGFKLSVTAESSPISYSSELNSFLVDTDDKELQDSTILVTIDSYLVDYPSIIGEKVTIPVDFIFIEECPSDVVFPILLASYEIQLDDGVAAATTEIRLP